MQETAASSLYERASMTAEERGKAVEWFKKYFKGNKSGCPICGSEGWNLSNQLAQVPLFARGEIILNQPVFPFMVFACKTCSYSFFVNALEAGVIAAPAEEKADTKSEEGATVVQR